MGNCPQLCNLFNSGMLRMAQLEQEFFEIKAWHLGKGNLGGPITKVAHQTRVSIKAAET